MSILDSMPEWKSGPFTNDDLARLKEHSESNCPCAFITDDIPKLLARLEAAEAIIDYGVHDTMPIELLKAWRKSKGDGE